MSKELDNYRVLLAPATGLTLLENRGAWVPTAANPAPGVYQLTVDPRFRVSGLVFFITLVGVGGAGTRVAQEYTVSTGVLQLILLDFQNNPAAVDVRVQAAQTQVQDLTIPA